MYTTYGGHLIDCDDENDPDHFCPFCGSTEEPCLEEVDPCAYWICVDCDKVVDSYEPEIDHSEELPF